MKKVQFPKGLGLPMILSACGILAMATGVVGAYAINNLNALTRQQIYDQSHYAAYSGIQWALGEISKNPRVASQAANHFIGNLSFPSNPHLSCKVYIYSHLTGATPAWTQAPDGTLVPENTVYVVADAQITGQTSTRSGQLSALCTPKQFYFDHALLGDSSVEVLDGSRIDGYEGSSYTAPAAGTSPPLTTLATNSSSNGAVLIDGAGTDVYADALVGKDGTPSTGVVVTNGAQQTGNQNKLTQPIAIRLDHPPGKADTSLAGGLNVANNGLYEFDAGKTYLIDGDLRLGNNARIRVKPNLSPDPNNPQTQDAFVFVKGDIVINNGAQLGEPTTKAEALQIYVPRRRGSNPVPHKFTMDHGTGSFLLAGPDLQVEIQNESDIQGGVIANKVKVKKSQVHYDKNLLNQAHGPMGWSVGGFDSDNRGGQVAGPIGPGPQPPASGTTTGSGGPGPLDPVYDPPYGGGSSTALP